MSLSHANVTLRSLQVFEASARCESFTAAGHELGITQSAVSRQVGDLEALLGVSLFRRNGTRITLSAAGDRLAQQLGLSFADIWRAVSLAKGAEQVVTVSMLPSLAARWFAPRLGRFIAAHPDIDLRVTASRHLVNFAAEGVDAAIRYTPHPQGAFEQTKLGREQVTPVCSPEYAAELGFDEPEDLSKAVLLHGDIPEDWNAWFKAAGLSKRPPSGPSLGDDGAILQAAIDGQGVALGRSRLVQADIEAGRLIAPFGTALEASFSYWFVRPREVPARDNVERVKDWFRSEFAEPT